MVIRKRSSEEVVLQLGMYVADLRQRVKAQEERIAELEKLIAIEDERLKREREADSEPR